MSLPDFPFIDDAGYDPYNHVGKQIRRHELYQAMRHKLRDKVLVMDSSALDVLQQNFRFRETLDDKIKHAFLIPPSILGTPVIRHDNLFGKIKIDDV